MCTVARDLQTASQDISLSPVISGPGHLICCTALFTCGPCDNFCYLSHTRQVNHAIAKMTARCAQYMSALKIVGLCKRKISQRLRKNRHITILSLIRRWNYFWSIPFDVITVRRSDLNVSYRRTLWHHRAVKIGRQIIADIIGITMQGTDHRCNKMQSVT